MAGKGTDGSAIAHISRSLKKQNGVVAHCQDDPFVCAAASDSNGMCRDVLCALSNGGEKLYPHVFGPQSDRFAPDVKEALKEMKKHVDWASAESRAAFIDSVREYVNAAREDESLLNPDKKAHCYQCNKRCHVHCKRRRFTLVVAGTPCLDFCPWGGQQGITGEQMEHFTTLVAELLILSADFVILENSEQKTDGLHASCAEALQMEIITGIDTPKMWSIPVRRPRRYSFLWKGDRFDSDASFEEYVMIFGRSVAMRGDALMVSSEEEQQQYMRYLAEAHGEHFCADKDIQLKDILSQEEQKRVATHLTRIPLTQGMDYGFTSIDQTLKYSTLGPDVPSLTRSSKIMVLRSNGKHQVATPADHLVFQGEAVAPMGIANDDYPCYWRALLDSSKLSPKDVKKLAGNAMHMVSVGQFLLYVLASVKAKAV